MMQGDPDGADTTACTGRSGAKRLILPTDVGYADGAEGPPPGDGKFTVNCGTKVGRYLYVQLVGLQRQLWVGEIKAQFTAAPATPAPETLPAPAASCTAGTQYVSNNQCVDCPSESTSSGTDATFCTCSVNRYAKKSGNTWTCEPCRPGQVRGNGVAGSNDKARVPTVSGDTESGTDCVVYGLCDQNWYLILDTATNLDYCELCPNGGTSRWFT